MTLSENDTTINKIFNEENEIQVSKYLISSPIMDEDNDSSDENDYF